MLKRLYLFTLVLLCSLMTAVADVTVSPTLEVNFRTASDNTAWQSGFPKSAADNATMEGNYFAGMFVLQKYTVADIKNATKLVVTLTDVGTTGVDGMMVWSYPNSTWTAESGIDDLLTNVTNTVGIAPRATEGDANSPLATGVKVANSSPAKATFTISGAALETVKATATEDGTFTLMFTDKTLKSNSSRKFQSINEATAEDNRPTLVATIETPVVVNKTTGEGYKTLNEAFSNLTDADTELLLNDDVTLTGRCTWSNANGHTLTITPTKDVTIKGHTNQMWFLVNQNNGVLNIGSDEYTITLEGQNKTFGAYAVTKFEKNAYLNLTNVKFQNFDLNGVGRLIEGNNNEGYITLKNITFSNCKNPETAFIKKQRVNNDKLILKGFLNIDSDCDGTAIYCASETQSGTVRGRIKLDDSEFTASNTITIDWGGDKAAGAVVVIKTTAANAGKFELTDANWTLERNAANGDLVMAKPVEPTAKIGDKTYADLTAALAAVQDGETITLLADQEVSSRINVKNMAITIEGGYNIIKRAESYKSGMMFLTVKADEGYSTALTLQNVTIDGQNVEATSPVMEASNGGTTTLESVTFQNCKNVNTTNIDAAIVVNKSNGILNINGVTFTDCAATVGDIFIGTNNVSIAGQNTIGSIYIENYSINAKGATATAPIQVITKDDRTFSLIVKDGRATDFTPASATIRLSQQGDDVWAMLTVISGFEHPALLHTSADIEAVKTRLSSNDALTNAAYASLETQSGGTAAGAVEYLKRMDQKNWSETYPDYNNFTRAATDAKLAYELALRYQLKGSTAAADKAVEILNNWAAVNKGLLRLSGYNNCIPDPNEYLVTIQAYQFANAAELLRDYDGWQVADQTTFKEWIRDAFADVAILFLENHHKGENPLHYWLNWDLAAMNAVLSVGVLCDDKALVDYALNYVDNGTGTGNKENAIAATHQDPDSEETLAQCQESGRDQGHSTLDVTLMGVLCLTAQNCGAETDLWEAYNALEMAEYVGKYNLKDAEGNFIYTEDKVPFAEYTNGEVTHTVISADARGTERPCWELFNAYAKKSDKADAYTEGWVRYWRDKNTYGEGEATTTDELGFGTLMFGAEVTPTGIADVRSKMENVSGAYYNLAGQRVTRPSKGLYIINGKKIFMK